ncbi:uncharacterized protein LOC112994158 [Dromaius novaehollandiae]|uniref:uncharacterized protein LOC112994158 n=1 Tax=Dromaius novaehollandiae TaxID=8790 RepID=UPI003120076F
MGVHEGQGSMREEVHGEGALRRLQALAGHTLIKRCRSSVRQLKDTGDPSARIGGTTPVSAAQKNAAKDRNRVLAAEIKQIREALRAALGHRAGANAAWGFEPSAARPCFGVDVLQIPAPSVRQLTSSARGSDPIPPPNIGALPKPERHAESLAGMDFRMQRSLPAHWGDRDEDDRQERSERMSTGAPGTGGERKHRELEGNSLFRRKQLKGVRVTHSRRAVCFGTRPSSCFSFSGVSVCTDVSVYYKIKRLQIRGDASCFFGAS